MVDRRVNKDRATLNDRRAHANAPGTDAGVGAQGEPSTAEDGGLEDQPITIAGLGRSGTPAVAPGDAADDLPPVDLRAPARAD